MRLGQPEGADLLEAAHRRQPPLPLFLGAAGEDGAHGQTRVHAEERRHRGVGMGELQGHETREEVARPGFRRVRVGPVHKPEPPEAFDQLEGELGPGPVVVDDRGDLRAEELADGLDLLPFPVRQQFLVGVEVCGQQPFAQVGTGRCRQGRGAAHGNLPQALWGLAREIRARRRSQPPAFRIRARLNADPERRPGSAAPRVVVSPRTTRVARRRRCGRDEAGCGNCRNVMSGGGAQEPLRGASARRLPGQAQWTARAAGPRLPVLPRAKRPVSATEPAVGEGGQPSSGCSWRRAVRSSAHLWAHRRNSLIAGSVRP